MDGEMELHSQLEKLNGALGFLGLMILSLGLSWKATALQREALCRYLRGEEGETPDLFSLRLPASAIVVGALTYFFGLALKNWEETRDQEGCARRSADLNLWAALLVLAAALIRLYDLVCIQGQKGINQGQSPAAAVSL